MNRSQPKDSVQWYLDHPEILAAVFDNIRSDSSKFLSDEICLVEIERLCSPSIVHHYDCKCDLHR